MKLWSDYARVTARHEWEKPLATSLWAVSTFLFLWYWSRRLLVKATLNEI